MKRLKSNRKRSSQFVFIVAVLLAMFVLVGNLAAAGEPESAGDKEIRFVLISNSDTKILDPLFTTSYDAQRHGFRVYDTLFDEDADRKPIPQMVDTWDVSSDGMVYTFNLRSGLLFHDGAPVTANDCVASLKRWMQSDTKGKLMAESVKDVVAIDDDTFEI